MGFPDAKRILACVFGGVLALATMAAHAFSASGLCGAAGEVMANVAIEHNDDLDMDFVNFDAQAKMHCVTFTQPPLGMCCYYIRTNFQKNAAPNIVNHPLASRSCGQVDLYFSTIRWAVMVADIGVYRSEILLLSIDCDGNWDSNEWIHYDQDVVTINEA